VAWAPGKGVKAKEWKDYWEVEQGVSYIPWSKLSNLIDFDSLEEGGSFDEESLPAWMRNNVSSFACFSGFTVMSHLFRSGMLTQRVTWL
jgi:hypothetical protein